MWSIFVGRFCSGKSSNHESEDWVILRVFMLLRFWEEKSVENHLIKKGSVKSEGNNHFLLM